MSNNRTRMSVKSMTSSAIAEPKVIMYLKSEGYGFLALRGVGESVSGSSTEHHILVFRTKNAY